jgi:hypothetical protein
MKSKSLKSGLDLNFTAHPEQRWPNDVYYLPRQLKMEANIDELAVELVVLDAIDVEVANVEPMSRRLPKPTYIAEILAVLHGANDCRHCMATDPCFIFLKLKT